MSELEQLKQEAEQLRNQIRVSYLEEEWGCNKVLVLSEAAKYILRK